MLYFLSLLIEFNSIREMHYKDVSRLYNLILNCNCGEILNTCEIYLQFSDELSKLHDLSNVEDDERIKRFDRALMCLEFMGIVKQKFKRNNDVSTRLVSITY